MCPKIGKGVPEAKLDVKETVNSVSLTTKAQRSTLLSLLNACGIRFGCGMTKRRGRLGENRLDAYDRAD